MELDISTAQYLTILSSSGASSKEAKTTGIPCVINQLIERIVRAQFGGHQCWTVNGDTRTILIIITLDDNCLINPHAHPQAIEDQRTSLPTPSVADSLLRSSSRPVH